MLIPKPKVPNYELISRMKLEKRAIMQEAKCKLVRHLLRLHLYRLNLYHLHPCCVPRKNAIAAQYLLTLKKAMFTQKQNQQPLSLRIYSKRWLD
jgi:hypothetical protein